MRDDSAIKNIRSIAVMFPYFKIFRRSIQRKLDRLRTRKLAIKTIIFDDDLLIRSLHGNGQSLILVFSGSSVKKKIETKTILRGRYAAEFAIIASDRQKNHVLFINDMSASYFSRIGMRDRVLSTIREYLIQNRITDVCAIGSSMGGYGAILFSKELPIRVVAAFAPALSLEPEITNHSDWDAHRPRFGADIVTVLRPIMDMSTCRYDLIFGDQDRDDQKHIALIPNSPNVSSHIIKGRGHGVARWLKEEGYLSEIVDGMFNYDREKVENLVLKINSIITE